MTQTLVMALKKLKTILVKANQKFPKEATEGFLLKFMQTSLRFLRVQFDVKTVLMDDKTAKITKTHGPNILSDCYENPLLF